MIPSNTMLTDSTTSGVRYIGLANSQSADVDVATWTIIRVTTDDNGDNAIEYAGGERTPKYKWSERATLTYK